MMDSCEIPRWQTLKAGLNNLSYDNFLQKKSEDAEAVCIDARTQEEFDQGHIPSAININYLSSNLAEELEQLDPEKHYYIYCRTSRRSLRVSIILKNLGFEQLYHLEDGIHAHLDKLAK